MLCSNGRTEPASPGTISPLASRSKSGLPRALGDEGLNEEVFYTLDQARRGLGRWRRDDNNYQPHSSLGGLTPSARRPLEPVGHSASDALAISQPMYYEGGGLSK